MTNWNWPGTKANRAGPPEARSSRSRHRLASRLTPRPDRGPVAGAWGCKPVIGEEGAGAGQKHDPQNLHEEDGLDDAGYPAMDKGQTPGPRAPESRASAAISRRPHPGAGGRHLGRRSPGGAQGHISRPRCTNRRPRPDGPASPRDAMRSGCRHQQDAGKDPHAPVKREGEVQAEGPFNPLEAGGQGHLQHNDGKGEERKAAAQVIGELILRGQVSRPLPR